MNHLTAEKAREMASLRKTIGKSTGAPRSKKRRCPCGVMTLKRAQARGRTYEHDPSCTFYPGA
jgi:hypothetical protein